MYTRCSRARCIYSAASSPSRFVTSSRIIFARSFSDLPAVLELCIPSARYSYSLYLYMRARSESCVKKRFSCALSLSHSLWSRPFHSWDFIKGTFSREWARERERLAVNTLYRGTKVRLKRIIRLNADGTAYLRLCTSRREDTIVWTRSPDSPSSRLQPRNGPETQIPLRYYYILYYTT